ncbi:hypothetical protein OAU50_02155 [Planctomycetota bacterium]|nr:hypothetical protein [Planctomycetota bacterium]
MQIIYPDFRSKYPVEFGGAVSFSQALDMAESHTFAAETLIEEALKSNTPAFAVQGAEKARDEVRRSREAINGLATTDMESDGETSDEFFERSTTEYTVKRMHQLNQRLENVAEVLLSGGHKDNADDLYRSPMPSADAWYDAIMADVAPEDVQTFGGTDYVGDDLFTTDTDFSSIDDTPEGQLDTPTATAPPPPGARVFGNKKPLWKSPIVWALAAGAALLAFKK